MYPDLAQD
jgi:hypothetical protein